MEFGSSILKSESRMVVRSRTFAGKKWRIVMDTVALRLRAELNTNISEPIKGI